MKVGEVIGATSGEFVAQSYEVNQAPALGSLLKVKSGESDIFAVLKSATTMGIEPGRHPVARGKEIEEEGQLFRDNPQLLKLMRTLFTAQVLGYRNDSAVYQRLPPHPARLHSFVYLCEKEETLEFARKYDFLNLLLSRDISADQVAAACLRQMASLHPSPHSFLVAAGKQITLRLGMEVERLNYLLRSLRE